MPRNLILVRHAHRDYEIQTEDNGLSPKGEKQAEEISREMAGFIAKEKVSPRSVRLLTSPKLRCQETLAPLGEALDVKVKVDPLLDEQERSGESDKQFKKRIETFFSHFKEGKEPIWIACSHGDWIPEALHEIFGEHYDLKKGASVRMAWDGKKFALKS